MSAPERRELKAIHLPSRLHAERVSLAGLPPAMLGLFALLAGWLAWLFLPAWRGVALSGMVFGGGLIAVIIWLAGRAVRHTAYRTHRWTLRDTLVVLGCGLTLAVVLLPLPLVDRTTLYYAPYPRLTLPAFDPFMGLALLGLLMPAVVVKRFTHHASRITTQ